MPPGRRQLPARASVVVAGCTIAAVVATASLLSRHTGDAFLQQHFSRRGRSNEVRDERLGRVAREAQPGLNGRTPGATSKMSKLLEKTTGLPDLDTLNKKYPPTPEQMKRYKKMEDDFNAPVVFDEDVPRMLRIWQPNDRSFKVGWDEGETVGDLKAVIEKKTRIPKEFQDLVMSDVEMTDNAELIDDLVEDEVRWGRLAIPYMTVKGGIPQVFLTDRRVTSAVPEIGPPRENPSDPIDWARVNQALDALEEEPLKPNYWLWAVCGVVTVLFIFQLLETWLISIGRLPPHGG
eukprot:TRINITY_DN12767_c0_g1_i1.p1 TRINITY_DN12767_c0_g1~~TRINITY_DN12767_c0_g1_i1.p1  ORF type:complete len:292 (+),score=59.96 TRINITY_DN12767_c0_g1_i1:87-962(+)